jgi:hypothetical protein
MAVSTWEQIISITKEEDLFKELGSFEQAAAKRVKLVEDLLILNVRKMNEENMEIHAAEVESYRQAAVRIHSLAACFLEHAKSTYFALSTGTEATKRAKEKMLTAAFEGMVVRYEGLVRSIDSRVNLCKALLRLNDERVRGVR